MDLLQIGNFLAQLRNEKKITQSELGEMIGISNKTISRWETGMYLPPVESLKELSDFYGVSINELISGKRLNSDEYKTNAETNIKETLKVIDKHKESKLLTLFMILLVVSSAICILAIELVGNIDTSKTVRIVIILLVTLSTFITNTLNICLYAAVKDKFTK